MNAPSARPALFLAPLYLLVACSSTPPAPTSAPAQQPAPTSSPATVEARAQDILDALRTSQLQRDAARALAYAERALAQEPQRAELLWLTTRLCMDVPRCDPSMYEARLRKADAGNGVVWMGPLTRAQEKGDHSVEAQILEAMGKESRFDVYWNSLLSQAALTLSKEDAKPAPKMLNGPLTNAINDVADWLTAVVVPPFAGIANACSRERTGAAQVAERCRNVAKVLQQGDTYAAEAVGIGIAQRAVSEDSPSTIALTERAAVLAYQHDAARDVLGEQVEREKLSAELIELMRKLRREQEVSLAVLRWAGLPLTPK
jgi:hypothetical protein